MGSKKNNWGLPLGALIIAGILAAVFLRPTPSPPPATPPTKPPLHASLPKPESEVFGQYAGSASCRDCHPEAYDAWGLSHHGLAERPVKPDVDSPAFDPPHVFQHGNQESIAGRTNNAFAVTTLGFDNRTESYPVERVIGANPLRQFLVSVPGGRVQTLEVAFDPNRKEWFDIYGNENRQPGEWGHWTGRGMTWNTMCASCHNTRLRKNYDESTDTFKTRMAEMSVGCEACHGPQKKHVDWHRANPNTSKQEPGWKPIDRHVMMETCGMCHSRRVELTGDFAPGDHYADHHVLTVVDGSDLYYPDGQVRDENYEYASFLSSRMHAAGVTCMDCHHPHLGKTLLKDNQLCLRCHSGGYPNSPIINPLTHTFHKPGTAGDQCVGCHMPQTVYMMRHPRRDHGFTIPDPLLTQQHGIPNACNRCHNDKDTAWAMKQVEEWYGSKMDRHTRHRAQWIAAARKGEAAARDKLIALLQGDDIPYWKASAANLLDMWAHEPAARKALHGALAHTNALVRGNAVNSVSPLVEAEPLSETAAIVRTLLEDPVRSVRYQAAWALRAEVDPASPAGRELAWSLDLNADFPSGQMQKGALALSRKDVPTALQHYSRAVNMDPNSAPLRHELAVVLSMSGNARRALEEMQRAVQLAPNEAEYHYKLGLAWNEMGSLAETISALEKTVALDATHARAWYNLGIAHHQQGNSNRALEILLQAETLNPTDPGLPYTRATILVHLQRPADARAAVLRALDLEPNFPAARQLLNSL